MKTRNLLVALLALVSPLALAQVQRGNGSGTGAPTNATYVTKTANGSLSGEFALSSLATGLLKNTSVTGDLSIATAGLDYLAPAALGITVQAFDSDLLSIAGLTPTDNNIMLGNGTAWANASIPNCTDASGNHLNYDGSTNTFSCGTSSSGGGGGGGSGTVNTGTAGRLAYYASTGTAVDDFTSCADGELLSFTSGAPTCLAGVDINSLAAPTAVSANDFLLGYSNTDGLSRKYSQANARTFLFNDPLTDPGADTILMWDDSAGKYVNATIGSGLSVAGTTISASGGGGGGAPTGATYIVQTPDATLSAEQAMSALATGLVKNTTSTGVLSIAAAGTDYVVPAGNVATATSLSANPTNCSAGQAPRGVDASGAVENCTTYLQDSDGLDISALTAIDAVAAGDLFLVLDASASNAAKSTTAAQIASYVGAAGGAPTTAKYIVQTSDGTLSAEQALGALATGIVKNTTTTGVLSIAASTDIIGMFSGTCTSSSSRYLATDGSCQVLSGGGDASTNTASSVDSEVVLFSGTGGKTLKRATQTGIAVLTSGVLSAVTAPASTIVGISDTQTLTNKSITGAQITSAVATATALAANGANCSITGQAEAGVNASGVAEGCITVSAATTVSNATTITADCTYTQVNQANTGSAGTLTIANPGTCTPTDGQHLDYRVKSTNAQTYSFGSQFRGGATALPTGHTGSSKTDYLGFIYNAADTKWDYVANALGF